jgi:hypothetical protein
MGQQYGYQPQAPYYQQAAYAPQGYYGQPAPYAGAGYGQQTYYGNETGASVNYNGQSAVGVGGYADPGGMGVGANVGGLDAGVNLGNRSY